MVETSDKTNKDVLDVEDMPTVVEKIDLSDDSDDDICEQEHLRKLFIGGLAGQTTEGRLRQFYSKWGRVVDSVVMRDPVTKRSRGFGFVTFSKSSMVDKAQANRPHIIDGKTVESKRALPRPENPQPEVNKTQTVKKLFVGGVKDNHDEKCLTEYFSEFGTVVSVKILTDNITGKRRGFALIEFNDYDSVDKAILKKTHLVNNDLLDVKKSVYCPDSEKRRFDKRKDVAALEPKAYQNKLNKNYPGPRGPQNQMSYQGPPKQQYTGQRYNQMPVNRYGPPPNNQWGPPPPIRQVQPTSQQVIPPNSYPPQPPIPAPQQPTYHGGYPRAPMPPVTQSTPDGHWNNYYQSGSTNDWSAPPTPTQPPAAAYWQNNQWGPPAASQTAPITPRPKPPAGGVAPPANWQPPAGPHVSGPPQQHPATGMHSVPAPPNTSNNFGNGYQQNYGGGPTKHFNMHAHRMNPYNTRGNHYNANGYENTYPNGNRR